MYYVSLCDNSRWRYEITDTDSGKSVSVSYVDLQNMYRNGVEVKGVSLSYAKISASDPQLKVEVYALPTSLMAKDLFLRGYSFIRTEDTLRTIKILLDKIQNMTLKLDKDITILGDTCIPYIPAPYTLTLELHENVTSIHKHFCSGHWDERFYLDVSKASSIIQRQAYYAAGLVNASDSLKFKHHSFSSLNQIFGCTDEDTLYYKLEGCLFGAKCTVPESELTSFEYRFLRDHKNSMLTAMRLAACSIPKVEDYITRKSTGLRYKEIICFLLGNDCQPEDVSHIRVLLVLLLSFSLDETNYDYLVASFLYLLSGGTDKDIKETKDFVLQNLFVALEARY